MAYVSKDVTVDVEIDLDDFEIDELADEIVKRDGWRVAIVKASTGLKNTAKGDDVLKELVDNYRLSKPIDEYIQKIAYEFYGKIV